MFDQLVLQKKKKLVLQQCVVKTSRIYAFIWKWELGNGEVLKFNLYSSSLFQLKKEEKYVFAYI